MELLSWLLDQLPYPIAITLVIVGLLAGGVKIFTEHSWKTAFQSKLFIFPSLVGVYTLVLFMGLVTYTKFSLLPLELDKHLTGKTNPKSFPVFVELQKKVSTISITFKTRYLEETRAELYEHLDMMEEFRNKEESIPNSFFDRKAELKGRVDRLRYEIEVEQVKALYSIKTQR